MNTDRAWEAWGSREPYFGVLSDERFLGKNLEANLNEFFASGEEFVTRILAKYENAFGPLPRGNALDYGCGVGRITLPLAQQFENVVGVDVSTSMLKEAEQNAIRRGKHGVRFDPLGAFLNSGESYDFVNTYIVLQHIPVRRGMKLIDTLIQRVRPGGGFFIHFSTLPDDFRPRLLHFVRHSLPLVNAAVNVAKGRPASTPAMQMNPYSIRAVLALLDESSINETLVFTERHGKFMTVGLLGRKPS